MPKMSAALDAGLLNRFRGGERVALARAISLVENMRPGYDALLDAIHQDLGRAHRLGITGPPGAGKSTLTACLIGRFRKLDETVGVVAIDPTSTFTGGALLGDRIRMNELATDSGVFIRSMATRGALGGLATSSGEVADLLDAFGFDRVITETVGVGQSELDIADATDTTVVVLVPESGDSIQTMKAGLMEVADLFVVNKADRPGADRLVRELEMMLHLRSGDARGAVGHHGREAGGGGPPPRAGVDDRGSTGWTVPVLKTVAQAGEGLEELSAAIESHRAYLVHSGELARRRRSRVAERVRSTVDRELNLRAWGNGPGGRMLRESLPALEANAVSPYSIAARIVEAVIAEGAGDIIESRQPLADQADIGHGTETDGLR